MTKYPCTYYSTSKRAEIALEDMATPHLMNAWRKLYTSGRDTPENRDLVESIGEELRARGCTLDPETGRWALPSKEGE